MSDETKKIQITRIEEKFGVKVSTGSHTVIVLPAHMEILVGGPYEKHGQIQPYGHVAIRVTISKSDMTYDFGRYGKTWGAGDSEGEGMLRVWTDFSKYITGEKATALQKAWLVQGKHCRDLIPMPKNTSKAMGSTGKKKRLPNLSHGLNSFSCQPTSKIF